MNLSLFPVKIIILGMTLISIKLLMNLRINSLYNLPLIITKISSKDKDFIFLIALSTLSKEKISVFG